MPDPCCREGNWNPSQLDPTLVISPSLTPSNQRPTVTLKTEWLALPFLATGTIYFIRKYSWLQNPRVIHLYSQPEIQTKELCILLISSKTVNSWLLVGKCSFFGQWWQKITNNIFSPQNSAWTIVRKKRIVSQLWQFCWNSKGSEIWEVNSHSSQMTQEEEMDNKKGGTYGVKVHSSQLLLWLLCEKTLQKQGMSYCRTLHIRHCDARSWVTLTYGTKFGTRKKKKKSLFEKHWHLQVVTFLAALWAFDHMPAASSSFLLHGKNLELGNQRYYNINHNDIITEKSSNMGVAGIIVPEKLKILLENASFVFLLT